MSDPFKRASKAIDADRLRTAVMAALERACRANWQPHRGLDNDKAATNWGPYSGDLRYYMTKGGTHFIYAQVRAILAAEIAAGRVLRASPHSRVVRYWLVGLVDKIEAERAAVTRCKRCDGEGSTSTGVDEAPTTICNACDGTGERAAQEGGAA